MHWGHEQAIREGHLPHPQLACRCEPPCFATMRGWRSSWKAVRAAPSRAGSDHPNLRRKKSEADVHPQPDLRRDGGLPRSARRRDTAAHQADWSIQAASPHAPKSNIDWLSRRQMGPPGTNCTRDPAAQRLALTTAARQRYETGWGSLSWITRLLESRSSPEDDLSAKVGSLAEQ